MGLADYLLKTAATRFDKYMKQLVYNTPKAERLEKIRNVGKRLFPNGADDHPAGYIASSLLADAHAGEYGHIPGKHYEAGGNLVRSKKQEGFAKRHGDHTDIRDAVQKTKTTRALVNGNESYLQQRYLLQPAADNIRLGYRDLLKQKGYKPIGNLKWESMQSRPRQTDGTHTNVQPYFAKDVGTSQDAIITRGGGYNEQLDRLAGTKRDSFRDRYSGAEGTQVHVHPTKEDAHLAKWPEPSSTLQREKGYANSAYSAWDTPAILEARIPKDKIHSNSQSGNGSYKDTDHEGYILPQNMSHAKDVKLTPVDSYRARSAGSNRQFYEFDQLKPWLKKTDLEYDANPWFRSNR